MKILAAILGIITLTAVAASPVPILTIQVGRYGNNGIDFVDSTAVNARDFCVARNAIRSAS